MLECFILLCYFYSLQIEVCNVGFIFPALCVPSDGV